MVKYGIKASSGGGRSSARETIGRVASGAIAEVYLKKVFKTTFNCFVTSIGDIHIPEKYRETVEQHPNLNQNFIDEAGSFLVLKGQDKYTYYVDRKVRVWG